MWGAFALSEYRSHRERVNALSDIQESIRGFIRAREQQAAEERTPEPSIDKDETVVVGGRKLDI